jgi:hypothetical protein
MTIHQFLDVDEEAQISSFWDGTYIGQREEDGYLIICHQVNSFYVEYKVMKSTWDGTVHSVLIVLTGMNK